MNWPSLLYMNLGLYCTPGSVPLNLTAGQSGEANAKQINAKSVSSDASKDLHFKADVFKKKHSPAPFTTNQIRLVRLPTSSDLPRS